MAISTLKRSSVAFGVCHLQHPAQLLKQARSSESTGRASRVSRAWRRAPRAEQVTPEYFCGKIEGDGVILKGQIRSAVTTVPMSLPSSPKSHSSHGSKKF